MSVALVVDDEPGIVALVSMSLGDLATEVIHAADLDEARAQAMRFNPTVILLDISLGSEDGLDFLTDRDPAIADIPVVVCSIHDSRRAEALARGAVAFLTKPFRRAELRAAVADYVGAER